MTADGYEYAYALLATNGRSNTRMDRTTYWLTSKNGSCEINELLREGWEPVRETPPSFSVQDVRVDGTTEQQNVGVSLVVLRRRCQERPSQGRSESDDAPRQATPKSAV